ncbi:hypothetical protein F0P96_18145 [Hymenobacter busanensis]|uniref:Uncharacterized protein n=2 Tax=Hymenobacter busanensis TaxID=2607656 RepID=A0AA88FHI5_9BACT|nr:hypothetical protein [Hymenobacter busanensis]KAA9327158.1 hypothetical protein F0P96_18145 [Hymenobacter busanensis]
MEGLDPDHRLKHMMINAMKEADPRLLRVRMHKDGCKFLSISMRNAPMTPDFKKDKRSEKNMVR